MPCWFWRRNTRRNTKINKEEISTPTIAKISTAKGNEDTPHFIDTDTNTPNLSPNELEEFITRKYNENVSRRNHETFHPKDIPTLESSSNIYRIFQLLRDVLPQALIFIETNTTVATISKIKTLRNDIYEFLLDEIRFLREEIVLKNKIIKSLFTVESISLDDQTFTHKVERTKNDQKKKKKL